MWLPAAAEAAAGAEGSSLEVWKFYLSIAGGAGAIIVFAVGLWQYSRAQQWKRAEFLALEIKELLADAKAANALIMIDWALRRIRLRAIENPDYKQRTVVTYAMQCRALQPHTVLESVPGAEPTSDEAAVSEEEHAGESAYESQEMGPALRRFSRDEALIRDCYDALLDRLDRLGAYIQRGLMSPRDMEPYLGYYVRDITESPVDEMEALWSVCFLTYVHFYHFSEVPVLFRAFGRDIAPDGDIFDGFMRRVPAGTKSFVSKLQGLAIQERDAAQRRR
jgi:hypothetical protein